MHLTSYLLHNWLLELVALLDKPDENKHIQKAQQASEATSLCFSSDEPSQQLFCNLTQMSVHTEGKTVCVLYYCDALYRPTRSNHYLNITGSDTQHFKILMLTTHLGSGPRDFKPGIKIAGEQALLGYYLMKQQFKMSNFSLNFGGIWTGLLYISDVHRGHILHVSKQFDTLQSSFAF